MSDLIVVMYWNEATDCVWNIHVCDVFMSRKMTVRLGGNGHVHDGM